MGRKRGRKDAWRHQEGNGKDAEEGYKSERGQAASNHEDRVASPVPQTYQACERQSCSNGEKEQEDCVSREQTGANPEWRYGGRCSGIRSNETGNGMTHRSTGESAPDRGQELKGSEQTKHSRGEDDACGTFHVETV